MMKNTILKQAKQNISLLLVLAMLLGMAPRIYATELEAVPQTETAPVLLSEETVQLMTEMELMPASDMEPESDTEVTEPEATEPETTEPEATEPLTFCQTLLALPSLREVFDAMMADPQGVYALTLEELSALRQHTQSLYDALEAPTQDDDEYLELILDTLTLLEEEQRTPIELLDESVEITRNGSRLKVTGAQTCQWQRSGDGSTYADIEGETQTIYDLTTADSGMYLRVKVGDNTFCEPVQITGRVVVFDLAKAVVKLGATYSGKDANDQPLNGDHTAENIYIIQQSGNSSYTTHNIEFTGLDSTFNVTLDGVNMGDDESTYPDRTPDASGIGEYDTGTIKHTSNYGNVVLYLKGENIVRVIHYSSTSGASASLKITDINGDKATDGGSLYVPVKVEEQNIDAFVAQSRSYNHWNSGIGGDDSSLDDVYRLEFAGGYIQVLTTYGDNCTAIGAGGNGPASITISGGKIVAHCSGTGAAIGGGIGWHSGGGTSTVNISGGEVYAKNHGKIFVKATYNTDGSIATTKIVDESQEYNEIIGGVAIGSGSSVKSSGSAGTINISGGNIKAYGTYGNGIGGGNSSSSTGGSATINITGGIIEATSIGGGKSKNNTGGSATVTVEGTANVTLLKDIGGGSSDMKDGGTATVTVKGGTLTAKSIGGGVGGTDGNGGAAKIAISGGTIRTGSIGGGTTLNPNGQLGHATADITDGDISGQFLLKGAAEKCYFRMSGGTLHGVNTADHSTYDYAMENGAAVYMDDSQGEVTITGGTIQNCSAANGGAVYMTAGTFTLSDQGEINNCHATENGGAVYLGGGTMIVSGGSITGNSAEDNGGAAYVNGGNVCIYGTADISGNTASNNGGGVAVNNGNVEMSGGKVDTNHAVSGNGGGIYVSSSGTNAVKVDVLSGSVSRNTAGTSGGALAVSGPEGSEVPIDVTVGINENHFDGNGNLKTDLEHGSYGSCTCPVLDSNNASISGGAVYVTGGYQAKLNLYCLTETGNAVGEGNTLSDFMMVEGGTVEITTEEPNTQENDQDGIHGHTVIKNTIYVVGGKMDIWGIMTNPDISNVITVDIKSATDSFTDHRQGSAEARYYKLLYYENFTDPITNVTTGQYKEFRIEQGTHEKIKDVLYTHTGYQISGWNTKPDKSDAGDASKEWETDYAVKGWYYCNDSYLFDDQYKTSAGDTRGDLILYAIWEPIGYLVVFDPNVEENEPYFGSMEPLEMEYGKPKNLPSNAFSRPGWYFKEWNTRADGTGDAYGDGAEVNNLSHEVGTPATLYAQWTPCDHDPDTHTYIWTANGDTLTGKCPCNGLTVTAALTASDTTYNQQPQEANLKVTISGTVSEAVEQKLRAFTVSYEKYALPQQEGQTEWMALDAGKFPINAGSYRASINKGNVVATVEYAINKASQAAPPVPEYELGSDQKSLSVKPVAASTLATGDITDATTGKIGYDSVRQYKIVYDTGNGQLAESEWTEGNADGSPLIFNMNVALTNYYVYARYSEGTNYLASEPAQTSEYFYAGNNVKIQVINGKGVEHTLKYAGQSADISTGLALTVTTRDGYYFPKEYKVPDYTVTPTQTGTENLLTITKDGNTGQVYKINNIPDNSTIVINLEDAVALPTISSYVTEGQIFTDFVDSTVAISADSAYTVRFEVENADPETYTGNLVFSPALPTGTVLILMQQTFAGTAWYRATTDSGSEISLSRFVEMGTENSSFAMGSGSVDLQLVVNVSGSSLTEDVETQLKLVHDATKQPNASDVTDSVSITVHTSAEFTMSVSGNTVVLSYTASQGKASIWQGRDQALVLKAKEGETLPADAQLQYTIGGYNYTSRVNAEGNYVIPLGSLTPGANTVTFSLSTGMEAQTYQLDAIWYVANSLADTAPMNGMQKGAGELDLSVSRAEISLKVTAESHLYDKGAVLNADVQLREGTGYTVKLEVQQKNESGVYQSTGTVRTINTSKVETISLSDEPGSYRLYLYAYTSYGKEETFFYFIIQ